MLERGEIVIERLTGRRVMVVRVLDSEEVTCRFADGRLEDRYTFELEPVPTTLEWLLAVVSLPFVPRAQPSGVLPVAERFRPALVPQPRSA